MEHNRIADQMRNLRPGWSDEIIYQEARCVIIMLGFDLYSFTYNLI